MGKNLLIKGDSTKPYTPISILEMFGGFNAFCKTGTVDNWYYYINNEGVICSTNKPNEIVGERFCTYTIDEFYEKFPYKEGDTVFYKKRPDDIFTVNSLSWHFNTVFYTLVNDNETLTMIEVSDLSKTIIDDDNNTIYKNLLLPKDQDDKLATEISYNGTKFIAPEGWLMGKTTKVNDSYLIEYVKKPTVYPNTYEECCKVMGVNHTNILDICQHCDYKTEITYYEDILLEKIEALYRLYICRDAYWKIAGEEMGLGESWKPDWANEKQSKYGLYEELRNTIINSSSFAFPTTEMRDAFYNNFIKLNNDFKDII